MLARRISVFFFSIPRSIWGLGFVSLLINLSSIIIFSLTPIYLTSVLGITTFTLGFYEGIVEFISQLMRISSGVISDYFRRRKLLLLIAYGLTALSRPFFAIGNTVGMIVTGRILDRISNGLQATPREALVGDLAPKELKGACYGLRQTLTMTGSFIGAFVVWYLLKETGADFAFVFKVACVPPILALLTLIFFVKDSPISVTESTGPKFKEYLFYMREMTRDYWTVVLIAFVFMLSNYSGAFMILKAGTVGYTEHETIIVMIMQNLFAMLSAFPIGRLSDRIDRRYFIGLGFLLTIAANMVFAFCTGKGPVLVGAGLWGLQMGMTQSLLLTKISDTTRREVRGTAFGIYYLLIGVALLLSNNLTGYLDHEYSKSHAFIMSALIAGVALLLLPMIKSSKQQ